MSTAAQGNVSGWPDLRTFHDLKVFVENILLVAYHRHLSNEFHKELARRMRPVEQALREQLSIPDTRDIANALDNVESGRIIVPNRGVRYFMRNAFAWFTSQNIDWYTINSKNLVPHDEREDDLVQAKEVHMKALKPPQTDPKV